MLIDSLRLKARGFLFFPKKKEKNQFEFSPSIIFFKKFPFVCQIVFQILWPKKSLELESRILLTRFTFWGFKDDII
jgi:hypothetical protein